MPNMHEATIPLGMRLTLRPHNTRDQLRGALHDDASGEGRTPLKRPSSVASRCSTAPPRTLRPSIGATTGRGLLQRQ